MFRSSPLLFSRPRFLARSMAGSSECRYGRTVIQALPNIKEEYRWGGCGIGYVLHTKKWATSFRSQDLKNNSDEKFDLISLRKLYCKAFFIWSSVQMSSPRYSLVRVRPVRFLLPRRGNRRPRSFPSIGIILINVLY